MTRIPQKMINVKKHLIWDESVSVKDWIAAARLCALDLGGFAETDGGVTFWLMCNDIFAPASDAEDVPPYLIQEVWGLIEKDPDYKNHWRVLMKWVAKRRGYPDDMVWFFDRKR